MLARHLVVGVWLFSFLACSRLSPQERQVIGTWERRNFDGSEYFVLEADHSCKFIMGADPGDYPRPLLGYTGTWRIDGGDLVFDWTGAEWSRREDGSLRKSSGRERLDDFLKYMIRQPQISYDERPQHERGSPHASNQTMERTATRFAFALSLAPTSSLRATLALGGRRSSCSR